MLAYHVLSPALSVEEAGLMAYLQSLPDAGLTVTQATAGLQNLEVCGKTIGPNRWTTTQQISSTNLVSR